LDQQRLTRLQDQTRQAAASGSPMAGANPMATRVAARGGAEGRLVMQTPGQTGLHHAKFGGPLQQAVMAPAKGMADRVPPLPPLAHWFTIDGFFGTRLTRVDLAPPRHQSVNAKTLTC